MEYEFAQANLLMVVDHAAALDITLFNLTLLDGRYRMTAQPPFPADQLEHLGLIEV